MKYLKKSAKSNSTLGKSYMRSKEISIISISKTLSDL